MSRISRAAAIVLVPALFLAGLVAAPAVQAHELSPWPVTSLVATPGDNEITVTWEPGSGGFAPTAYWVNSAPVNNLQSSSRRCTISDPSVRSCTFYPSNGQHLNIEVIAINRYAAIDFEAPAVTLYGVFASPVPEPPTITTVTYPSPSAMRIDWTESANMPAPTTKTRVVASPGGAWCESGTNDYCGISDLENGQQYELTAYSYNAAGASLGSEPVSATPFTTPAAPTNPGIVVSGLGSVTVTWDDPTTDGGRPITGYRVELLGHGAACDVSQSVHACTFTGLSSSAVRAAILASNENGGDASASTQEIRVPLVSATKRALKKRGVQLRGLSSTPGFAIKIRTPKGKYVRTISDQASHWRVTIPKKKVGKGRFIVTGGDFQLKV